MVDTSKLPISRVDGLNDILNSKSNYIIKNKNTDFDTLIETGLYYVPVDFGSIDITHCPVDINSTVWFITVHTQKSSPTRKAIWQYAHSQNSIISTNIGTNLYARTYNSYNENETGVWTEWYQISGAGLDMPSKKYIDITDNTWNQGLTGYTAIANGYISLQKKTDINTTNYIEIFSNNIYGQGWYHNGADVIMRCLFPVSKNDYIKINSNITNTEIFQYRFIYANSEVPMSER